MANVSLPCDSDEWFEDKRMFTLLSQLRSVNDLEILICSHTREGSQRTKLSKRLENLKGLMVFLKDFCTLEEQDVCARVTLPFIALSACRLEERVPESGIPFLPKQESAALVLGRKLVLSLLANVFLCTFPASQFVKPLTFYHFFEVFRQKDKGTCTVQAAKLKCILCYFQRATKNKYNSSGVITLRRQVVAKNELPSLRDWTSSQHPLCNFEVSKDGTIESLGPCTLQVNFAEVKIGDGVLGDGHAQEVVQFCIFPELMISQLIMDPVDANEAIVVTGTEQFSQCKGYGSTLEFGGDYEDHSERDVFGNFLTSTVAIDDMSFGDSPQKQYDPESILRELNKAYAGFFCQQDRGDISTDLLALNLNRPSTALVSENYVYSPNVVGTAKSSVGDLHESSQPPKSVLLLSEPALSLYPIKEDTELSYFPNTCTVDSILKSGIKMVTKSRDTQAVSISSPLTDVDSKENNSQNGIIDFVSSIATDILESINDSPSKSRSPPLKCPPTDSSWNGVEDLASSLSSSIINSSIKSDSSKKDIKPVADEPLASKLTNSIISDVFSTVSKSPPAQMSKQPKNISPQANKTLALYSDQLAGDILTDAFSLVQTSSGRNSPSSTHPAIYIQVERRGSSGYANESPRSSRSSSLTGQAITLHEFTDELAENVIKDGLTIAQFTSQGQGVEEMDREEIGQFAERLVSMSITEVVNEHTKKSPPQKPSPDSHPMSLPDMTVATNPAKKPHKHGLLFSRQELALTAARFSKRGSVGELGESDSEMPSFQLNSRLLTPTSSRVSMGYAWSTASTRDEDSRPVSPTNMDRIALSLSNDIEDYSYLFSKILVSDAILSVSGERPNCSRIEEGSGTLNMISLPSETKIDTFLSRLDQAEVLSQYSTDEPDTVTPFVPTWQQKMKTMLLRPVATGNWGCGAFRRDPQLKSMIQWVVASLCGRPSVIYCLFNNERVQNLGQVCQHLLSKEWTAGQLCQVVIDFCELSAEERERNDLFSLLLSK